MIMKSILFTAIAALFMYGANAQWSQPESSTNNIYYNSNPGNVGIGTSNPSEGKLQIGNSNNSGNYKLVIPGVYNFERVKLGQYGNGAGALEFINHKDAVTSYGIRLLTNVDQVQGLQFQYAPPVNAETGLSYATSMFIKAANGNVGIGTTNPNNKLQIADGADDATSYGSVQIIRPTNPGDNRFHLSFIRNGQMVSGIGYVSGTNTLGIWAGVNTQPVPVISFLQNQSVGIGTTKTDVYKLAVEGAIGARKVVVNTATWADYVFDSSYDLKTLDKVEQFIKVNKHLPEVPSAATVEKEGVDLGNNQVVLLKKIEELTLYLIEQNKEMQLLNKQMAEQNKIIEVQQKKLNAIADNLKNDFKGIRNSVKQFIVGI
jgi:uncharacterized coiled-coil protein SlyX